MTPILTSGIGATFSASKVGCDGSDLQDPVEEFDDHRQHQPPLRRGGRAVGAELGDTGGGKGSCYRVTMTTADGSAISADFKLK